MLALLHDRLLVDAGAGIRAHELAQLVNVNARFVIGLQLLPALRHLAVLRDDDLIRRDGRDLAGLGRNQTARESRATLPSRPVPTSGASRNEQRHALALHVRTHQRAVRVVVLEERNQPGGHRDELLRRDVHVVDLRRLDFEEVAAVTDRHFLLSEMPLLVDRRVRLRDEEVLFAVAGEIIDLRR